MIVNRTNVTVRGRVINVYPLRTTSSNNAVLNFRIAANERQRDPITKVWSDRDTFYISVSCWDGLARRLASMAIDRQMVVVMGTLATKSYEKDGVTRSYPELRAQHVAFDQVSVETLRQPAKESDKHTDSAASTNNGAGAPQTDQDDTANRTVQDAGEREDSTLDHDQWPDTGEAVGVGAGGPLDSSEAPF